MRCNNLLHSRKRFRKAVLLYQKIDVPDKADYAHVNISVPTLAFLEIVVRH